MVSKFYYSVFDITVFLQYIKLLRKMGEIDKLRKARESMSEIFPMTPTMWQEWTKDEITLSSGYENPLLFFSCLGVFLNICIVHLM